ncbi:MAG: sporulation protein YabP, partial [Bacilli bacterium]|nr:sporulation protein YabP [Bacilli bacterium]
MNTEFITSSTHEVKIVDRKEISFSGVKKIVSFDAEEFLLETIMGMVLLKGNGLELLRLDTHDGNV